MTACLAANTVLGVRADASLLDVDELQYYNLAGDLLRGEYAFNPQRTLGHVGILALVRLLTLDNFYATQIVLALLSTFSAPLTYLLVRRHFGNDRVALIVALMVMIWGPFLYYNRSLYSEGMALPVFLGFLLLLPNGSIVSKQFETNWLQYALAGFVLSLCMLIRPMYLLFVPFALLMIFLEGQRVRVSLRRAAMLLAGCILVLLPWSGYMTMHAGVPILVSANGGETLSGGLNPEIIKRGYEQFVAADGRTTWTGPGKWLPISQNGYLSPLEQNLPYAKQDGLLKQRTLQWAINNPGSALYLEIAKLLYMWGIYPFWNGLAQTIFGSVPTLICLALSAVALVRFRRNWRELSRFWLLPVFVSCVALVSWGSWRFRQPGDIGLLVLTGLVFHAVMRRPLSAERTHDAAGSSP
jgi:4-amino-4-deoxy-L-arabinose transferase-like glycosyltransferase